MPDVPSRPTSPPADETIRARAEECQRIVDEAISTFISGPAFLDRLKVAGATPDEARDYVEQYTHRRRDQDAAGLANAHGEPALAQPGGDDPDPANIATLVAWALLRAKVNHFQPTSSQSAATAGGFLTEELAGLLGLSSTKGAIPASVLAKAPHLFKLSDPTATDPHLEKTQELLSVYSPQTSQDILVNKAQFAPVSDPLPRTFWRKILLDSFVDFEKLFASMDKGYDHHDDPKDFGGGYALVTVRRIKLSLNGRFRQKLIGYEFLVHGLQVWFSSFLTGILSFETIMPSSWTFSTLYQTLSWLFHLMCTFVTSIRRSLFILMIEPNSICRSLPRCFRQLLQSFHARIKELLHLKLRLQATVRSVQTCLAATGALVCANPTSVRIAASLCLW
jgi:hypothetical protein